MSKLEDLRVLSRKIMEFNMLQHIAEHTDHEEHHDNILLVSGQGRVMVVLAEEANLSQNELAKRLEMTPQSTAELVAKLIKRGFVAKERSLNDGRVWLIRLTDKGWATLRKIGNSIPPYLQYLDEAEQQQLGHLLDKMNAGMTEYVEQQNVSWFGRMHKVMYQKMIEWFK